MLAVLMPEPPAVVGAAGASGLVLSNSREHMNLGLGLLPFMPCLAIWQWHSAVLYMTHTNITVEVQQWVVTGCRYIDSRGECQVDGQRQYLRPKQLTYRLHHSMPHTTNTFTCVSFCCSLLLLLDCIVP